MLEEVLATVVEEAQLNKIVLDLEKGHPRMKDKLKSRLRSIRMEEMLAIRKMVEECLRRIVWM